MAHQKYVGSELDLFGTAMRWKTYYTNMIRPYLGTSVLEVGAGLGMTTQHLCANQHGRWVCLEPDPDLAARIEQRINQGRLSQCEVRNGILEQLPETDRFDSILYIDVIEHIYDDAAQLRQATNRLAYGGHLIILAPAHYFLFSEFDKSIGHHRRYTKQSLSAAVPDELSLTLLRYIDSLGLLLSLGNRFLNQRLPNKWQIDFWDRFIVPVSAISDKALNYRIGKSVLGIWQKS